MSPDGPKDFNHSEEKHLLGWSLLNQVEIHSREITRYRSRGLRCSHSLGICCSFGVTVVFSVKGLYEKCLLYILNRKNGQDSQQGHGALEFILNQLPNQSWNVEIFSMFPQVTHFPVHNSRAKQSRGSQVFYWAAPIVGQLGVSPVGEGLPRVSLSGWVLCSYIACVYFYLVTQQILKGSKKKAFSFLNFIEHVFQTLCLPDQHPWKGCKCSIMYTQMHAHTHMLEWVLLIEHISLEKAFFNLEIPTLLIQPNNSSSGYYSLQSTACQILG